MKKSVVMLAAFVALGSFAMAQSPHSPPTPAQMAEHRVARYTTLLSLNASQVEEATSLFTTEAESETTLRTSERSAHQALDAAVKSGDTAAIGQAATSLGQLNGQLTEAHALADAKFYAILTSDQKTKFAELEHDHGMRGPEGPPPPQ